MLSEAIETPTNPRYVVARFQRVTDVSLAHHIAECVYLVLNGRIASEFGKEFINRSGASMKISIE